MAENVAPTNKRMASPRGAKRAAGAVQSPVAAKRSAPTAVPPSPAVPNYAAFMRTGTAGSAAPTSSSSSSCALTPHEAALAMSSLGVFMEDALADAVTYVAHAGRAGVGAEDMVLALKAQVFACKVGGDCGGDAVLQRETQARLRARYAEVLAAETEARRREMLGLPSEDEDGDDGDGEEEGEEQGEEQGVTSEEFTPSTCECKTCALVNRARIHWGAWEPDEGDSLSAIVKKALDKTGAQFLV